MPSFKPGGLIIMKLRRYLQAATGNVDLHLPDLAALQRCNIFCMLSGLLTAIILGPLTKTLTTDKPQQDLRFFILPVILPVLL